MLVHAMLRQSRVNGPGRRVVVWFQGCNLRCSGCWNQSTHAFDPSRGVPVEDVGEWILGCPDVEGVTFSGGEPMQQADELLALAQLLHTSRPNLSLGMFTGYNLDELESGRFKFRAPAGDHAPEDGRAWISSPAAAREIWTSLRPLLDFAVAGRFQESKISTAHAMRSSTNQRLHLFTERYRETDFPPQSVEITIRPGGLTVITGFPVGAGL